MKITFKGNVGKDAQLRKVQIGENQISVVSIWVAENIAKRDGTKKTEWHKVTIWRKYAETMAQYLKKGRSVLVEGVATAKSYTTQDNRIVPYIDIQAEEITLLDRPDTPELPPEAEAATEDVAPEAEAAEGNPWD